MIRKRTIAARVERLWALTKHPRTYPITGTAYHFLHVPPTYVLNRGREGKAALSLDAMCGHAYASYGYTFADAHEYAHGWDFSGDPKPAGRPESTKRAFRAACGRDSLRSTRPHTNLTRADGKGYIELFADAVAFTIVNDRTFISEHPAKYRYVRAQLRDVKVIR